MSSTNQVINHPLLQSLAEDTNNEFVLVISETLADPVVGLPLRSTPLTFATNYGQKTVEELVRIYDIYRRTSLRHQENRNEFNQTDEGKIANRERAKSYYEYNKDTILARRKDIYKAKKEQQQLAAIANHPTHPTLDPTP